MNQTATPVTFGLAGLGGYAAYVCDRILAEARGARPAARLLVVAEPHLERFPHRVQQLQALGVTVVRDFAELLSHPVEAVWLPIPIDLHLPFTEQALAAGKAVMCEKPAAGCVDDVDRMIAARDRAALPVAVGFQDIYQPAVTDLKRRLIGGEFGRPTAARVIGCWPRSEHYFTRNDWAGRLRRNGRWVLDSPANNALAHFLHLTLFLLGEGALERSAEPSHVAAELYRANRIENYDTCTLRVTLERDAIAVLVALTHASATTVEPVIVIETERATIRYVAGRQVEITTAAGAEHLPLSPNPHHHMLAAFGAWVRDGVGAVLGSSLEMARAHVVAVNAASEAAHVVDVAGEHVVSIASPDGSALRTIDGIVPAMTGCIARGCLLHESGLAPWTRPAGAMLINGYKRFAGPGAAASAAAAAAAALAAGEPGVGEQRVHATTFPVAWPNRAAVKAQ